MTEPATGIDVDLDFMSFNYDERKMLQREFACDFRDLVGYALGKFAGQPIDTSVKLRDADGNVRFADEVIRYATWIVRLRTDPAAKLEEFDGLGFIDAAAPVRRGKASRARKSGTSPKT